MFNVFYLSDVVVVVVISCTGSALVYEKIPVVSVVNFCDRLWLIFNTEAGIYTSALDYSIFEYGSLHFEFSKFCVLVFLITMQL